MTRLGLSLPSTALHRPRRRAVPSEAAALLSRMTVPPSAPRVGLVSSLVSALRGAGVWDKLDTFYMLAAHDPQAARLNWIAPQYDLTAVSGPTFTADRGYAGNGTSSYLESGFNPSTALTPKYTLNNASLSVWLLSEAETPLRHVVSAVTSDRRAYLNPRQPDGTFIYAINTNADRTRPNPLGSSIGMFTGCRPSSGSTTSYVNGDNALAQGNNSNGLPNVNVRICGRDASFTDTRQVAFACMGASLTAPEVAALHVAVRAYLMAVGAISP